MTTPRPGPGPADPGEFDRLAVVTIQGGGVYGLNMLGQLAAVIDHAGITPMAFAGTSAGAVVAALSWAGYSPKEIRELFARLAVDGADSGGEPAPGRPGTVVDLLGPTGACGERFDYGDFRRLAALVRGMADWIGSTLDPGAAPPSEVGVPRGLRPALVAGAALVLLAIGAGGFATRDPGLRLGLGCLGALGAIGAGWALGVWRRLLGLAGLLPALAWAAIRIYSLGYLRRGFFAGDHLEAFLDRCLKDSPRFRAHSAGLGDRPLTFGWVEDLQKGGAAEGLRGLVPLILTATNLTTRELILIQSFDDRFRPLSVARAVRASAGFPVFFRPVDLRCPGLDGWYVDGGMISNFPAWVFSDELRRRLARAGRYQDLALRPWLNIGLRVVPDRPGPAPRDDRPSEFLASLLDLARGQVRNELEKALAERLPRAIPISQPTSGTNAPAKLLDVDHLTDDKIRAMFARGEEFAREALADYSFALPAGARKRAIERSLRRAVGQALSVLGQPDNGSLKLRAHVSIPRGQELVVAYAFGMGDDPDRGLRVRYDAGLIGFCFRNRRPFLGNLRYVRRWAEQAPWPESTLLGLTRDEHLAVRDDRTWLACVPIFDPVECWFLDADATAMERDPEGLAVWTDLPGPLDGAVFGVLSLDGAIPYDELGLPEDPEASLTDPRVASIFDVLQACASGIGRIFSQAFGRKRGP